MSVDVKAVSGRRDLRYESFDELIADVEALVASPETRTLGNWSLAQLLAHVAAAINRSLDNPPPPTVPWRVRMMGRLLKGRLLKKGMAPGRKLPTAHEAVLYPPVASAEEGFQRLQSAVARAKAGRFEARHAILGRLTHEEWILFHLRHAAMHLSFAVPGVPATAAVASTSATGEE